MIHDRRLAELDRAAQDDPEAAMRLLVEQHRITSGDPWLDRLADRETWGAAPEPVQDAVIAEVARRLGVGWESLGARVWSCRNGADPCVFCRTNTSAGPCRVCFGAGVPRFISHRLGLFVHKATGMEFSLVPGDRSLHMKVVTDPNDASCNTAIECDDEDHDAITVIRLLRPLLIGRSPVIGAELDILAGYASRSHTPTLPACHITHPLAARALDGSGMRLPRADEWEHACRSGSATPFYWGDQMDDSHCWHQDNSGVCPDPSECYANEDLGPWIGGCRVHNPRAHAPIEHEAQGRWNAFGLVDMIGNVWEWCSDESRLGDHAIRGGSFASSLALSPGFAMEERYGAAAHSTVGFRAACSIPKIGVAA